MALKKEDRLYGGKRENQKMKILLVWHYLLNFSDEKHAVSADDIIAFLGTFGVNAEKHSIGRDIKTIKQMIEISQTEPDIQNDRERINYEIETTTHGTKVITRPYEFEDLKMLAACVRSARFISEDNERRLLDIIFSFCSDAEEKALRSSSYVTDVFKTSSKYLISNLETIDTAIKENRKIKFTYNSRSLKGGLAPRRSGARYPISPLKITIKDGNFYLLASVNDKLRTYRIDRMSNIAKLDDEIEEHEHFKSSTAEEYIKESFSMFSGERVRVSILFKDTDGIRDAVIERLGYDNVTYFQEDEKHFKVRADIQISKLFYSWICSFGTDAVVTSPPEVVEGLKEFVDKIKKQYD